MRFSFLLRGGIPLIFLLSTILLFPCTALAQENKEESAVSSEPSGSKESSKSQQPIISQELKETADQKSGTVAQGAEGEEAETSPVYEYTEPEFGANRASYPMLILRTFAVLAVIVVVIWLIFRFLLKSKNKIVADTDIIRVLVTYPLAANRFIKVIDIAGKILILGVTDSNISLITEVADKELIDRIKLMSSKEAAVRGSFKEQFLKLIGGRELSKAGEISYLRGYKERINRMKKL